MSEALEKARELGRILEEAEGNTQNAVAVADDMVQLSTFEPGEVFKIGEHDFVVLEQKVQVSQTVVISKGFMAENVFDADCRDYNESSLKELIETDIQPIIEAGVGADNLIEHEVDLTSVDMQNEFGSCTCKVRLITFDEARKYNNLIVNKELKDWWWTCTPWSTKERGWKYSIAVVSSSGNFDGGDCGYDCGVRPVCILKSNIFVSKGE